MTKKESVDAASMHPIVHTPGPWVYDSGAFYADCQLGEDGMTYEAPIAELLEGRPSDAKGNAILIAASPMMKELLLDFCDSLGDNDCIPTQRQMLAKKAALALLAEVV
jgi:hypothetical protein